MLNITGPTYRTCDGLTRRGFLKAGFSPSILGSDWLRDMP
jgi:hypothetical protein